MNHSQTQDTSTTPTTFKCKITETTVHIDLIQATISKLEQPDENASITFAFLDLFDTIPHILKQDPDIFRVLHIQNTPPHSPTQTTIQPTQTIQPTPHSSTKKKGRKPGPWFQFWINNVQGSSQQHYEPLSNTRYFYYTYYF
jgi:hypothetical protein